MVYDDLIFLNLFRNYKDEFAKAGRHDFMVYLEEMVKAGEYGIALEDFLVQMYEYDLEISSNDLDIVRKLCENMSIDSNLWSVLSTKIPSDKDKFLC
ncbi:hypothetical protein [uncultured Campylobacter sp.]|uniref:hypothetical protein n=1 Tax=uncultured Campylobacter sp. TaxID=218934 RepID=UPI0026019E43|nr:hypothetical protein [uncultured Campylobacter sp.]